jgi:hypothetical protein
MLDASCPATQGDGTSSVAVATTTLTVVNDRATYFSPSRGYDRLTGVSRREEHVGDEDQLAVQRGVARH